MSILMKIATASFLLALIVAGPVTAQTQAAAASQSWTFIQARFAAAEGDFEGALKLMDQLVRERPGDPYILYERAEMLLESGRVDRALTELRRLAASSPEFYEAQRLLGRLLLDQARGRREELTVALEHLRQAYSLRPSDTTSGMILFQVLMSLGELEEASTTITELADRNPDHPVVNYSMANLMIRLGRSDEAKRALERVIVSDPSHAPAVLQLVEMYQKSGEWLAAAKALENLEQQDPLNDDLQRQLGYFHLRSGNPAEAQARFSRLYEEDPADRRHAFFLAEALNDLERFDEAEALYRDLLRAQPEDAEFLVSLGLNLMGQRRFDEAGEVFQKLLTVEAPTGVHVLAQTQLATIEHFRGEFDDALARAQEVVRGPRGLNSAAVSLILDVHRKQKNYDAALEFLEPIVEESGDQPGILSRLLEFQLRAGRQDAAAETAERIRKLENGDLLIASIYSEAEQFDRSLAILEPMYRSDPAERRVAFQLGATYERAGRHEDAEKMFLEILDRDPEDAATLNYLGYMWADRNENLERALEMISTAVRLEPRNAAYLDSLGWVYYRQGDLRNAEKYLLEAAKLMPWDPTIQEHVGDLFVRQGRHEKAVEHYRIALRLEPPAEEGEKIRTKLAEAERRESQTQQ